MNILMISLHYHDYTRQIAEELRMLGHEVSLHDIMPRDLPTKAIRILAPGQWQRRLDRHHVAILKEEKGKSFDMVLFIQVHQMSRANLAAFRQEFRDARFALYNWDSIANHDYREHLGVFDHVFTFDPGDAKTHNLIYLPLFCSRTFQGLDRREQDRKQVYFVGNIVNPRRYAMLEAFRAYCRRKNIEFRAHAACTPPSMVRVVRAGHLPRGLKASSIEHSAFIDLVETSIATFDYANHDQAGYTMRVIENLCAGKKIITNNERIAREPFFSPDRIHLFDGTDFEGVGPFLETPLVNEDADFPEFHIQAFVRHIIDGTGHSLHALGEG